VEPVERARWRTQTPISSSEAPQPQETGFLPKNSAMHMRPLGIGERLRNTREARGLSLDDVEASIRIRRRYLEALEAETFHAIPGPAYVRGFLRTYAAYLGLPAEELVAMYPSHRPDVSRGFPVEVRITPGNPYSRIRRIVTGVAAVFGLGVVLLGVMLYGQIRQFAVTSPAVPRAGHTTTAPARPAGGQTAPSASPAPSQAPSHTESAAPAGAPLQALPSPAPVAPTTLPVPKAPAATPTASQTPAPAPPAPASPTPAPPAPATPAPAPPTPAEPSIVFPGPLEVVIVANDRTWVRTIADGVIVYDGFVSPGERQAWQAHHQVVIRVGNASALDVTINGLSLGRFGTSTDVAERTFTAGTPTSP